jgi:type II secretion system protein G
MKKNDDEGFTLIELLIVIVILGILAAVVVFAVGGITDKGKTSACKADFKTVEVAVEAYYAKNGSYPTSVTALTAAPDKFLRSTPKYAKVSTTGGVVKGVLPATQMPASCPV